MPRVFLYFQTQIKDTKNPRLYKRGFKQVFKLAADGAVAV
jgi:hypothetical protein